MSIQVNNPIIVDQKPLTLDKFWLRSLVIDSEDPNCFSRLIAKMEKIQDNGDGTFTKAPEELQIHKSILEITELEPMVATDGQVLQFQSPVTGQTLELYTADIIMAVTLKIKQMAETKGLI